MPALLPLVALLAVFIFITTHAMVKPHSARNERFKFLGSKSKSKENRELIRSASSFSPNGRKNHSPLKDSGNNVPASEIDISSSPLQFTEDVSACTTGEHTFLSQISSAINAELMHIQEHQAASERLKNENRHTLSELEKVVADL